jgi:hypothetical protein
VISKPRVRLEILGECPIAPLRALILSVNRLVTLELSGQTPEIRALSGAMGQQYNSAILEIGSRFPD